ncbi:MAG: AI-2E family transporter [Planctomycetes bacterium]|nr:AI-2E family transporter [Planctomycetota bacterium]
MKPDEPSGTRPPAPSPKDVFESEYDRNPLSFLAKPRVQKSAFWILLLAVLLYLRSFFALIFLTFLFSVLMEAVVRRTPNLIPPRRGRVVMVFLLLLAVWAGLFVFLVPRIAQEFERAVKQVPKLGERILERVEEFRLDEEEAAAEGGHGAADEGDRPAAGDRDLAEGAEGDAPEEETPLVPTGPGQARSPEEARTPAHAGEGLRVEGEVDRKREREPNLMDFLIRVIRAFRLQDLLSKEKVQAFLAAKGAELFGHVPTVIGHLFWAVTVFLLSLIFSFLIVWDFPRLVKGYYSLERTRAGPFFQVARETFSPFGQVLAQALGAQTVIALVNTALTAIGMAILKIPLIEVLAVIVFLCSFIPVAGVFISSAPICVVSLGNNGFGNMLLFIVVVIVVHLIEAYILNPRIYGAHLSMNPLVVLVLLVVGHHLLGLWGLLLVTPVTAYVFHHVLKSPDRESAAGGPEAVPSPAAPT